MGITILVVDDSKLARIVTGKALTALQPDWERVEAANADEAMRVFDERAIDLVLIDSTCPAAMAWRSPASCARDPPRCRSP